jgi:hypothetical protein
MARIHIWFLGLFCCAVWASGAELPAIPVGLDAYRQWERWPEQRLGMRSYMRSTYDRRGGNESADAAHFLYQLSNTFNVTLDVTGPGLLAFARYNHWHGSPWHYEVDGQDHTVQETSTANPNKPVSGSIFLPAEAFPNPLAWTWSVTKGADLSWVPVPFERSFRMAYSRTRYGTGYYIFQQFVPGVALSQPLRSWSPQALEAPDVLELLKRSGSSLVPGAESPEGKAMGLMDYLKETPLKKNAVAPLLRLWQSGVIRALEFTVPKEEALAFGRARLRVWWDGRKEPSIDAPIALFFGAGTLYNRDNREYLVKAFPCYIRYTGDEVRMGSFFPMPFFRSARLEIYGADTNVSQVKWKVQVAPFKGRPAQSAYFHATYKDQGSGVPGKDLVLLDTRGVEGSPNWSGSFVGTSFIFSHEAVLNTLEGDPRFFFDDSESPQAYGTGTEEWGGGGDYWGGLNMTLPFAGHPVGARSPQEAKNAEDKIESAYRFLLSDLFPFGKNARIQLEHGGVNDSVEHYKTLTYWYGLPAASLVKTDTLKIGDKASEGEHGYQSPQASEPYTITSRYELGPDQFRPRNTAGTRPSAQPTHFAEWEFEAPAGTYAIWVRGRALEANNESDADWLQFDEDIGTTKAEGYGHAKGFGNWLDRFPAREWAWSSALPQEAPRTITFQSGGKHLLRLQPRHGPHQVETIWLSAKQRELPDQNFTPTPGTGEIVLTAAIISKTGGQVTAQTLPQTNRKVLAIQGAGASAPMEVYPAHTDQGRKTRGTSEFTLKLDPANLGVMLRRKLDYQFPNQRAEVFVSDASGDSPSWQTAGIWYLAGGNTCVYSDPREELGATQHNVQTSNRRFRDDEFLLPKALTQGRSRIRVRVQFVPVEVPLFPGHPLPELAWTEIRYDAYCWVEPVLPRR